MILILSFSVLVGHPPHGAIANTSEITKNIPLRLLHLMVPPGEAQGKDTVTVVFNRQVRIGARSTRPSRSFAWI